MTDRHSGYIVVLEENIREDDAQAIINALKMVKGVIEVKPIVADSAQFIAESRAELKWRQDLHDLLEGRLVKRS